MPIVGDVIRIGGSPLTYSSDASNVGGAGGTAYSCFRADGQRVGMFQTSGAAKKALQRSLGGIPIVWDRDDLTGDIERYVGRGGTPDPREVWGDDLAAWHDAGLGITRSGLVAIRRWSDRSGSGNSLLQATGANQGALQEINPDFRDRSTVDLVSAPSPSYMDYVTGTFELEPPFTMMVVANATAAIGQLISVAAGGPFSLGVDAASQWQVSNGLLMVGPVASAGEPDIVVWQQTAAGATLRVNQAQVAANAQVPAMGEPRLGWNLAGQAWDGSVSTIVIATQVDITETKVFQMERFAAELYQS